MNNRPLLPSPPEVPDPSQAETAQAEDLRLVQESLAGREAAFEALFRKHRERVYRIAFRFTRNRDDALELTQDVFIKAHRRLATFTGQASFLTWLCRITANAGIDWKRRQKNPMRSPESFEDIRAVAEEPAEPGLVRRSRNPAAETMGREMTEKILEAVEHLSEKHRAVFVLHAMEGLTYGEIAEAVGCKVGTVMSRLHYARQNLKAMLGPYLGSGTVQPRAGEEEVR